LLLYYITDRKQFPGGPPEQSRRVLEKIAEAVRRRVEFIQLREKDLSARELELLARDAVRVVNENLAAQSHAEPITRLLINSRVDIALAAGADGVHLPANDMTAAEARAIWDKSAVLAGQPRGQPIIGMSCHSAGEVRRAYADDTDLVVFAPVFEKVIGGEAKRGAGLEALRDACETAADEAGRAIKKRFPVLALGGVTLDNAHECIEAGGAGVAGIRLFQENDIRMVVERLRSSS
jgi:thiamine-phosphate pyrophosphorylase